MTSRSVLRIPPNKGNWCGKTDCSSGEACVEITMLTRPLVEQGWQRGFAPKS